MFALKDIKVVGHIEVTMQLQVDQWLDASVFQVELDVLAFQCAFAARQWWTRRKLRGEIEFSFLAGSDIGVLLKPRINGIIHAVLKSNESESGTATQSHKNR